MARRRRVNTTKIEIVQTATKMFLEKGYTETSVKAICEELNMSTGNLTFYFPTKEHLLALLVKMLCDYQWQMIEQAADEGKTSLMALCLELTAMAACCEESEIAKDFYLSAYTHPITLDIIRKNDVEKARQIFGKEYCKNWKDNNFREAELLVSGIEYATMMTTESSAPLDVRIAGAIGAVMMIYNVPEDVRRMKIDKVLSTDYRGLGKRILHGFVEYTENLDDDALEALMTS